MPTKAVARRRQRNTPKPFRNESEREAARTEALATVDHVRELAEVGIWALVDADYDTVAEALADIHAKTIRAVALLRDL